MVHTLSRFLWFYIYYIIFFLYNIMNIFRLYKTGLHLGPVNCAPSHIVKIGLIRTQELLARIALGSISEFASEILNFFV